MTTNTALGLDIAKHAGVFEFLSADGIRLDKGSLPPARASVETLLASVRSRGVEPADCPASMESTGGYSQAWADALHHAGFPVYVVNPLVSKTIKAVDNAVRQKKSDPVDAHALAEVMLMHRSGLVRFRYNPDPSGFMLRKFASVRQAVRRSLSALINSTGSALQLAFPEWEASGLSLANIHDLELLSLAPSAPEIVALGRARLAKRIGDTRAAKVREAALVTFADAKTAVACGKAVRAAVNAVICLRKQLDVTTEEAREAMNSVGLRADMERKLRSITGIGRLTGAVLAAYLPPDFTTWDTHKRKVMNKLTAHFGVEPREHSSGQSRGGSHMSKRGSPLARTALYQSASMAVLHDGALRDYYKALRARNKPHKVAIIDVMRKIIRKIVCVFWEERSAIPLQKSLPTG